MAMEEYDCTTSSDFFEEWFVNSLLCEVPKGYTIIMDNASFHRKTRLRELAMAAGVRLLFLPTYSPDYNPIEHTWANMKHWLADNMKFFDTLTDAIQNYIYDVLSHFSIFYN